MVFSIMFMYAMSRFALQIAYISILLIEIMFLGTGGSLIYLGLSSSEGDKEGYFIGGGVLLFFGLIFNLLMCCYWKSLKQAIAIIDAAADFFVATKRLVLVSIFFFFVSMVMVLLWTVAMIFILSLS
mmetsp:Transcript_8407/g.14060  ORF Transcript_8407/g.14060 Transcript_8407/m.14060 type:complete len:127 (-) Transcript_8407:950-1330(-)